MPATQGAATNVRPYVDWEPDPRNWILASVAVLLALVGAAVVLAVVVPIAQGHLPSWAVENAPWNGLIRLIGVVLAVWIVVWLIRLVVWGTIGGPYYRRYGGRYYARYGRSPWGPDPAVTVARERYARGEITREQLDQILSDLGRSTGPLPPV